MLGAAMPIGTVGFRQKRPRMNCLSDMGGTESTRDSVYGVAELANGATQEQRATTNSCNRRAGTMWTLGSEYFNCSRRSHFSIGYARGTPCAIQRDSITIQFKFATIGTNQDCDSNDFGQFSQKLIESATVRLQDHTNMINGSPKPIRQKSSIS